MILRPEVRSSWIENVRALGVARVALALGCRLGAGAVTTIEPCPACGAEQRGFTHPDRRGPVGITPNGMGFRCHRCHARGDAVTFAAFAIVRTAHPTPDQWRRVREACAKIGLGDGCDGRITTTTVNAQPQPPDAPRRPPFRSVADAWMAAKPITSDPRVVAWMESRRLNAARVTDLDLARVIQPPVPAWARMQGQSWDESWPLILPMFDEGGCIASFHARRCGAEHPKGVSPTGFQVSGLVLADAGGAGILRNSVRPSGRIWIAEGVPDFLSIACTTAPDEATFGIISGSWSAPIADRIPSGSEVVIATHNDRAGDEYADKVIKSLGSRAKLYRWKPKERLA